MAEPMIKMARPLFLWQNLLSWDMDVEEENGSN
jgi:hypothetical protein